MPGPYYRQSERDDRLDLAARRSCRTYGFWKNSLTFDREVIPERRMHAKGSGAHGTFTGSPDITRYTKEKIFSAIRKKTELFT